MLTRPVRPLISLITVAELHACARKLDWGTTKRAQLEQMIRELVVVSPHQGSIVTRYAEIDYFCERECKPARPIGQNDMWIAATAAEAKAALITSDHDFDHLSPTYIRLWTVNAITGEPE